MEQKIQERQEGTFEMKVEEIKLENLEVVYHPRKNFRDLESLQNSIRRDGLQEPLLVYPTREGKFGLIDGYRRLKAVQEFGWQMVPCMIQNVNLVDAAHLSYVKNVERSGFDPIEIAQHLKAMRDEFGYSLRDLEMKGYGAPASISQKLKLLDLPDKVQAKIQSGKLSMAHGLTLIKLGNPQEQERWATRIIDDDLTVRRAENQVERYLKKGRNQDKAPAKPIPESDIPGVYIKDSRDMSELPAKSVHLIVSSPPYFVGMEYEKGMTYDEHLEMIRDVMKECSRVLVKGGVMALNVGDIYNFRGPKGKNDYRQIQLMGHKYQSFVRSHQVTLSDIIIWQKSEAWTKNFITYKPNMPHTSYRMMLNWEPVYIFRKSGEREMPSEKTALRSKLTRQQWVSWMPSVWQIDPVKDADDHPTVYPDELVRRLVLMFSYEGDTVLDPFLGSGTTVKVARELGREAVGYEREAKYKEVIMRRLGETPSTAESGLSRMIESIAEMQGLTPKDESDHVIPELCEPGAESAEDSQAESMDAGGAE